MDEEWRRRWRHSQTVQAATPKGPEEREGPAKCDYLRALALPERPGVHDRARNYIVNVHAHPY